MNGPDKEIIARLATPIVFSDPALMTSETAWSRHVPFAFWITEALRPSTFVELGVHTGVSYCAFCQAISQLELSTLAYGIDTWQGDPQTGLYGDHVLEQLRKHHDLPYSGFSSLLRCSFDEARRQFPPGSIDLLHIDGLHAYEAVKHDLETWTEALSHRGVVLLHDVTERQRDFGVWKLWDEMSSLHPSFTFPFGHGLGVLGVGDGLPEPVRWLLALEGDDQRAQVVHFFAVLGDRFERPVLIDRLRSALQATEGELQAAVEANEVLRTDLVAHREMLANHQEMLANVARSTSWRVTAPIRCAGRVVAKVRGESDEAK